MSYLQRVSYVEQQNGYQTYLFTTNLEPIRYKFFSTKEELNEALEKAKEKGWKIINATKLVNQLNRLIKN